jgi:hypothetical protein
MGFSADLLGHSEWDETEVLLPDTMSVGSISLQDTSHEGATEQSSVLLHMCRRVCEPQLSFCGCKCSTFVSYLR